jgi:urea transport system substrate-binding protein
VAEVCARHDRLLFYPATCEGLELSPNVVYLGGTPNQTLIPLVRWAYSTERKRRFFLVGSESIYSHAVNAILDHEVKDLNAAVVGTRYALGGETNFDDIVREARRAKADMVLCSVDGHSNVAFLRALRGAGIGPKEVPTVWVNVGESELSLFRAGETEGDYSVGCYFETIARPENQAFLQRFRSRYGSGERVNDSMQTAYFGVYLWKKAVEKAGGTDTTRVREALRGLIVDAPEGPVRLDAKTLHAWRTALIGRIEVVGGLAQFRIVYTSAGPVEPQPYPGWRSPAEWDRFLRDLREQWGGRWEKHK